MPIHLDPLRHFSETSTIPVTCDTGPGALPAQAQSKKDGFLSPAQLRKKQTHTLGESQPVSFLLRDFGPQTEMPPTLIYPAVIQVCVYVCFFFKVVGLQSS